MTIAASGTAAWGMMNIGARSTTTQGGVVQDGCGIVLLGTACALTRTRRRLEKVTIAVFSVAEYGASRG